MTEGNGLSQRRRLELRRYDLLQHIPKILTDEENSLLEQVPSEEEVRSAMFAMDGESAPGPHGYTDKFFTAAWSVIGKDVVRAVCSFFCGVVLPHAVTATSIELLSNMERSSRNADVALKLDMSKAYDCVSWIFFTSILRRFGFGEQWIDRIWRLLSNVWFSVLVNGSSVGFFKSTRELHQGDPLSPGLFIVGTEVLSRSLNKLIEHWEFQCFSVPPRCPRITHLSYADDVLVFSSASSSSLRCVMQTIRNYENIGAGD
nr:uncharacterized protein LOC113740010 [Coffea arabica]